MKKNIFHLFMLLALTLWFDGKAMSHNLTPPSLQGVSVPRTPGLLDGDTPIVTNKSAAIQLGKALFWDMNVGVDGIACASCHFHAGADGRFRNQLAPGLLHKGAGSRLTFSVTASSGSGGLNYQIKADDFPFYQLSDSSNKDSDVLFETDDVFASAGTFLAKFRGQGANGNENCRSVPDSIFHVGDLNVRQVTNRQAPSVINAAFSFRNFWDGRANNIFNGVSPYGERDLNARLWFMENDGSVVRKLIRLENSALASQAMSPPLSGVEMSCGQRTFPDIAHKLLSRYALENQRVHSEDGVLANLRNESGKGLRKTYSDLIKDAFAQGFWASPGDFYDPVNSNNGHSKNGPYTHMEVNFSLFFGIALQLYQQTLISDKTPFDTPRLPGDPKIPEGLNAKQKAGLRVFLDAHCVVCHKGPTLSAAAHPDIYTTSNNFATLRLVNRKTLNGSFTGSGVAQGIMDEGYFNTSVTPTSHDIGIGGYDPFGNPVSFTQQYMQTLLSKVAMVDPVEVYSCELDNSFAMDFNDNELVDDLAVINKCGVRSIYAKIPKPSLLEAEIRKGRRGRIITAVNGAFKVPSLRNVELTGPYMHNGGMLTLEQVVEFYFRGGNFNNPHHFATLVFRQDFTDEDKANLVEFLKALTDERVRWEKAPFDHPQLLVPHGHKETPDPNDPTRAEDLFLTIPAIGRYGRSAALGPIKAFHEYLEH
ncbi:cytochrome c peroxidase [Gammaproteobacteria bacterium]